MTVDYYLKNFLKGKKVLYVKIIGADGRILEHCLRSIVEDKFKKLMIADHKEYENINDSNAIDCAEFKVIGGNIKVYKAHSDDFTTYSDIVGIAETDKNLILYLNNLTRLFINKNQIRGFSY